MTPEKADALPAPCHMACPAGIDIPSYLGLLALGRYEEALDVIREDNPFAWVCGLICPHPCEKACVRAHLDDPINIRYLKAFVAEQAVKRHGYPSPSPAAPDGPRVAVIGSGPAGLSAAHYLALKKYRVTLYESLPIAGGLLMTGIPEFRLPRDVVRTEIAAIEGLGVDLRTGVTVGRDVTLDELRAQGYRAFFLATGAHRGLNLEIQGEKDYPQVHDALTFMREVSLGRGRLPGEKVVVAGGATVAVDTARTCVRLGCTEVHLVCKRAREQMPVPAWHLQDAMEEGVQFHFLAMPIKISGEGGKVSRVECLKMELGKRDASGRRRPVPLEGSGFCLEAQAVMVALGQRPDLEVFSSSPLCAVTPRNTILTDPFRTCTTVNDIFAGGDVVTGPASVVEAVAAGKQAALDIDHYLRGHSAPGPIFRARKRGKVPFFPLPAADKIVLQRPPMPVRALEDRRLNFERVELGLDEMEARREALRCLRCDVCIRCGACERVCRDDMKVHALDFKQISSTERILCDYDRPGERCIACGACAIACPTGAIDFLETDEAREVRLCGTVLNRLDTARCPSCGGPFVPPRYLQYVLQRSDLVMGHDVRRFCPKCARERAAEKFVKP